jgi:asparagine synthase (glutamine-hydrolysing)
MTATMVNRGPDAGGVWCCVHAAIGHRRLSVIDLENGEQPMRAGAGGPFSVDFDGSAQAFRPDQLRRCLT